MNKPGRGQRIAGQPPSGAGVAAWAVRALALLAVLAPGPFGFAARTIAESASPAGGSYAIHLPAALRDSELPSIRPATPTAEPGASPTPPTTVPPDGRLERLSQVGGTGLSLAAADGLLFVGHGARVAVYRRTHGSDLERIGESPPLDGVVTGLALAGGYVYAATTSDGVWVINATDPTLPCPVGHGPPRDGSLAIVVRGAVAYVAEGDTGLRVLDVRDPARPTELEVVDLGATVTSVALSPSGQRLFVLGNDGLEHPCCDDLGHLWIFDLTDPRHPVALGHLPTWEAYGLAGTDDTVYVGTGYDLLVIDVTDAGRPAVAAMVEDSYDVPFAVQDGVLYAAGGDGLALYDVRTPTAPVLLSALGDVAGYVAVLDTPLAFVVDGARIRIVDLGSPTAPQPIGETPLPCAGWQIHDLGDGFAYVDDDPVAVADVRDPARPLLTRLDHGAWPWGRILDIRGRTVVARSSDRRPDIVLVDASDPAQPRELGRFDTPYHPLLARLVGERLYVNSAGGLGASILQVIGVAEPDRPQLLGERSIGWVASDMAIIGDRAYVTLTPRTGDTSAESPGRLQVLDVGDPGAMEVLGELQFAHSALGLAVKETPWHETFAYVVTGDLYRAGGSGLYVIDVTDPARPRIAEFEPTRGPATDVVLHGERVVVSVRDMGDRHRWPWIVLKPSGHAMVFDFGYWPALDQVLLSGSYSWGANAWASIDGTLWAATADGGLMAWR